MLRITEDQSTTGATALRLEGQLIGPWVTELRRVCQKPLNKGQELKLDLGEVSFVDRLGVSLLEDLKHRGATLENVSAFLQEQLNGG